MATPEPTATPTLLPTSTPTSTSTSTATPESTPTPEPVISVSGEDGAWVRKSPWGEKVALLDPGTVFDQVVGKSPSGEWIKVRLQIGEGEETVWIYTSLVFLDSEELAKLSTIEVDDSLPPTPTPVETEMFPGTITPPEGAGRPFGSWGIVGRAPHLRSGYGELVGGARAGESILVFINISNDPGQELIMKGIVAPWAEMAIAYNTNPPTTGELSSLEELMAAGLRGDVVSVRVAQTDLERWQNNPGDPVVLQRILLRRYP